MKYDEDPIRRWIRRQQEENWIEVKAVVIGLALIVGITLWMYWTNFPLEME